MPRSIHVVIVEPDFFARNWMALILARDWRTRVVGEVENLRELEALLGKCSESVDVILVNSDANGQQLPINRLQEIAAPRFPQARIIWTSTAPQEGILRGALAAGHAGYLLKSEVRFSLAWALVFAQERFVLTPGLYRMAGGSGLPAGTAVLDGRKNINRLTEHEAEVARMALIFSMERRDLSDEMGISKDWSYGLVSGLYHKLGLEEILKKEVDPEAYLGSHALINAHLKEILEMMGNSPKARDMETLAFHLLTMPEIEHLP